VVGSALNSTLVGGSAACFASIAAGTAELAARIAATDPPGSDPALPASLKPCGGQVGGAGAGSATALADLMTYEATIFGNFQGVVQYNEESAGEDVVRCVPRLPLPPLPTQPLKTLGVHVSDLCAIMAPGGAQPATAQASLDALGNATALFTYTASGCVPSSFSQDFVKAYHLDDVTAWNESNRQWTYQSCNEFGYFQTTAPTSGDPATNLAPSGPLSNPFSSFAAINATTAGAFVCEASFNLTEGRCPANSPFVTKRIFFPLFGG